MGKVSEELRDKVEKTITTLEKFNGKPLMEYQKAILRETLIRHENGESLIPRRGRKWV